jgi:hemerythrin-like domain-containing protein
MPADLIDLLVAEHRRLESLFAEVETAGSAAQRRAALDATLAELTRHTEAEERFLHPALCAYLPAGPEIAAYEAAEHASFAGSAVADSAGLAEGAGGPRVLDDFLDDFLDRVRQHMQEEETELFPRLAQACPAAELTRLGEQLESARVAE